MDSQQQQYCICKSTEEQAKAAGLGDMIACDGGCGDWFHFFCLGMDAAGRTAAEAQDAWICPACTKEEAKRAKRSQQRKAAKQKKKLREKLKKQQQQQQVNAPMMSASFTTGSAAAAPAVPLQQAPVPHTFAPHSHHRPAPHRPAPHTPLWQPDEPRIPKFSGTPTWAFTAFSTSSSSASSSTSASAALPVAYPSQWPLFPVSSGFVPPPPPPPLPPRLAPHTPQEDDRIPVRVPLAPPPLPPPPPHIVSQRVNVHTGSSSSSSLGDSQLFGFWSRPVTSASPASIASVDAPAVAPAPAVVSVTAASSTSASVASVPPVRVERMDLTQDDDDNNHESPRSLKTQQQSAMRDAKDDSDPQQQQQGKQDKPRSVSPPIHVSSSDEEDGDEGESEDEGDEGDESEEDDEEVVEIKRKPGSAGAGGRRETPEEIARREDAELERLRREFIGLARKPSSSFQAYPPIKVTERDEKGKSRTFQATPVQNPLLRIAELQRRQQKRAKVDDIVLRVFPHDVLDWDESVNNRGIRFHYVSEVMVEALSPLSLTVMHFRSLSKAACFGVHPDSMRLLYVNAGRVCTTDKELADYLLPYLPTDDEYRFIYDTFQALNPKMNVLNPRPHRFAGLGLGCIGSDDGKYDTDKILERFHRLFNPLQSWRYSGLIQSEGRSWSHTFTGDERPTDELIMKDAMNCRFMAYFHLVPNPWPEIRKKAAERGDAKTQVNAAAETPPATSSCHKPKTQPQPQPQPQSQPQPKPSTTPTPNPSVSSTDAAVSVAAILEAYRLATTTFNKGPRIDDMD